MIAISLHVEIGRTGHDVSIGTVGSDVIVHRYDSMS
jgi:hypothetical protein